MHDSLDHLAPRLMRLDEQVRKLRVGPSVAGAVRRFHADAQALLFHLNFSDNRRPLVAVLGGTGTGKSTIVNRVLGANVSATSVRRTFTSGAVAVVREAGDVPEGWLGVERQVAAAGAAPARGEVEKLLIVPLESELTASLALVDTPDLDGDQPAHHAEADRVFRWADALVFLVTPEKYQMTELLPYYRLARRYALPAVFVMNKCEESAVVEDYRKQLAGREWGEAKVFAVPRDDAAWEPPADGGLAALRAAMVGLAGESRHPDLRKARRAALVNRKADLVGRLRDQILSPLKSHRAEIDRLAGALRGMAAPTVGVDVSPLMQQLQRRLREQSVLYLMGPQRVLQRLRQAPGMIMRLPRTAWDLLVHGTAPKLEEPAQPVAAAAAPDFPAVLMDQFRILQSRVDDLLLSNPAAQGWMSQGDYPRIKIDPAEAGRIAEQELAELKSWLEQRWHGAPRDTAVLQKLLKYIPGGKAISKWSETAPYLLAIVLATHGAIFGPVDLLVLGSYSAIMWIGEKLSNEVSSRARQANRGIANRIADLGREQIERVIEWLNRQAPGHEELSRLERMAEEMESVAHE